MISIKSTLLISLNPRHLNINFRTVFYLTKKHDDGSVEDGGTKIILQIAEQLLHMLESNLL